MDANLQKLAAAISAQSRPIKMFFRDDDGGWADERLEALGRVMAEFSLPMDIAVIPGAVTDDTIAVIERLRKQSPGRVNLHQHGFRHSNNEHLERKCEFGSSRSYSQQYQDIKNGWSELKEYFGDTVQALFTPPWNRCSSDTKTVLSELGYRGLSRIAGSDPLEYNDILNVDVSIDWFKKKHGKRLSWAEFCLYAQKQLLKHEVVGVMLHHQPMDDAELERLSQFITALKAQAQITFCTMSELCKEVTDA